MSFRAELKMRVSSTSGPKFLDAWGRVARGATSWNGLLAQSISRPVGSHDEFVIISEWDDEESFRAFETDPLQEELTSVLRELRLSSSMSLFEVIERVVSAES